MSVPMRDTASSAEPAAVPFGRILPILRRRFWIVAVALLIGIGGAVLAVGQMPKLYTAQTTLIIEPQRTQVSDLQAISNEGEDMVSLMRTQIDILSSPSLALGVVQALDLTHNAQFMPRGQGMSGTVRRWLTDHHLLHPQPSKPLTQSDKEAITAAVLSGKVGFSNQVQSRLLGIVATTVSPTLSAAIANEFAKQFLAFKVQEKFAAMQRAHDWLQHQVASLADEVRRRDDAVEAYRQSHGLAEASPASFDNAGGQREETINRQQLNATSAALVDVSRDLSQKEGDLKAAQAAVTGHVSPADLPAVLSSPMIAALLQQSAAAYAHTAELGSSLGAANPDLKSANASARAIAARTRSQIASVIRGLTVQVRATRAQKALLQQQLDQLRDAVGKESAAELGLNTLESQARATRSLYESFLTRAAQLANVAGIQSPDASLVSRADPPLGPSSPKRGRIFVLATALSLAIGGGVAVLLERLRSGFSRPEEIEAVLGIPLLCMLPAIARKPSAKGLRGPNEIAITASLNRLRAQMRLLGEARPRLLMVTSSLPKEGKSVFAARLAQNMAAAGWRVLLLECDFCRPSLGHHLDLSGGPGLCEILSGRTLGASDKLIRKPRANLDIILAGDIHRDSQEMLASRRLRALLADARARYDVVIMDTPPVLPVADALVLGQHVDATLAVVQWEKTPREAVVNAIRQLQNGGIPILGAIMTQVDQKKAVLDGGRISYTFRHYDGYHPSSA
ncbi:GumC family protein [Acidisoma sp.]|uniref:GumC family protein n=1 Tax=Acidisoma sp. TaxID=1872115 RepID=UPI002D80D28C|nr:polysaccharide biosynthesis tyrosine autokinase [Acidisoma sp.]